MIFPPLQLESRQSLIQPRLSGRVHACPIRKVSFIMRGFALREFYDEGEPILMGDLLIVDRLQRESYSQRCHLARSMKCFGSFGGKMPKRSYEAADQTLG
jgi:hypothetical protein